MNMTQLSHIVLNLLPETASIVPSKKNSKNLFVGLDKDDLLNRYSMGPHTSSTKLKLIDKNKNSRRRQIVDNLFNEPSQNLVRKAY